MQVFPDRFRFFFQKNGIKTLCKHAPEEWESNVIKWTRDSKTEGILTQYVDKFTFILEDAKYLISCFEQENVFSNVKFIAEEYNFSDFKYDEYYSGDLDFYSFEEDKYRVVLSVSDIGFSVALAANLDTEYEIDIPPNSPHVVYDGLILRNNLKGLFETEHPKIAQKMTWVLPVIYITTESVYSNILEIKNSDGGTINDSNWFLKINNDIKLNIKFNYDGVINFDTGLQTGNLKILFIKKTSEDTINLIDDSNIIGNGETIIGKQYELTVDANSKDVFYIAYYWDLASINIPSAKISANIEITYDSNNATTRKIKGIRPSNLLALLVEKATGGKYNNIDFSFLDNNSIASNLLVSSGNIIRGIENAKITTSLKDFFKAMQVLCGATYWFDTTKGEEKLIIKHVYDAFSNKRITYVDDINDYKKNIYENYIYNQLQIGYKDNTYDEVNGKYEFNTEINFSIKSNAKAKKMELVSPYRADMYGIEFLVLNYEKKDTTDSDSDNDTFVFHTSNKRESNENTYLLNRDVLDLNGVSKNTAFNVQLSPKHCLLRQISYISSIFQYAGSILKFSSSSKDYNMIASDGVDEHADINLSDYKKLFIPVKLSFSTKVNRGISALIGTNKNGYIRVVNEGKIIDGFILSISENPGCNRSQTWEILVKNSDKNIF